MTVISHEGIKLRYQIEANYHMVTPVEAGRHHVIPQCDRVSHGGITWWFHVLPMDLTPFVRSIYR